MKKTVLFLILTMVLLGCGVDKSEYDKVVVECNTLRAKVRKLEKEIDELKHGEERLIGLIENSINNKNYVDAENKIKTLFSRHPESLKTEHYKSVLTKLAPKLKKQKADIEKHKQDSIKLANINNLGIWEINYFVDEFGEPTNDGYITTKNPIYGTFSNTATEGSALRARFIIADKKDIAIKLFEYNRDNPVKDHDSYRVLVQDKDGERYEFRAHNSSDRITFSDYLDYWHGNHNEGISHSEKMHKILLKGGRIKIKLINSDRETTQYYIEIVNADWYENAYTKLRATKNKL